MQKNNGVRLVQGAKEDKYYFVCSLIWQPKRINSWQSYYFNTTYVPGRIGGNPMAVSMEDTVVAHTSYILYALCAYRKYYVFGCGGTGDDGRGYGSSINTMSVLNLMWLRWCRIRCWDRYCSLAGEFVGYLSLDIFRYLSIFLLMEVTQGSSRWLVRYPGCRRSLSFWNWDILTVDEVWRNAFYHDQAFKGLIERSWKRYGDWICITDM